MKSKKKLPILHVYLNEVLGGRNPALILAGDFFPWVKDSNQLHKLGELLITNGTPVGVIGVTQLGTHQGYRCDLNLQMRKDMPPVPAFVFAESVIRETVKKFLKDTVEVKFHSLNPWEAVKRAFRWVQYQSWLWNLS